MMSMRNEAHTSQTKENTFIEKSICKLGSLTSGTFDIVLFSSVEFRGTIIAKMVIDRFTRSMYAIRHPTKHITPILTRTGYMVFTSLSVKLVSQLKCKNYCCQN